MDTEPSSLLSPIHLVNALDRAERRVSSECYCSAPLTPMTTGLSVCWQMRTHTFCLRRVASLVNQMSHDSQNGVGHDVWRCAIFVSCSSCAGVLCKFEVFDATTGHRHLAMN